MKNILIIDDNEEVFDIFKQLLSDEGYHVSTANNGASGVFHVNNTWSVFIKFLRMGALLFSPSPFAVHPYLIQVNQPLKPPL